MKKLIIASFLITLLIPSIASAAWWDFFQKKQELPVSISTLKSTTTNAVVTDNQKNLLKQIEDLKSKIIALQNKNSELETQLNVTSSSLNICKASNKQQDSVSTPKVNVNVQVDPYIEAKKDKLISLDNQLTELLGTLTDKLNESSDSLSSGTSFSSLAAHEINDMVNEVNSFLSNYRYIDKDKMICSNLTTIPNEVSNGVVTGFFSKTTFLQKLPQIKSDISNLSSCLNFYIQNRDYRQ